MLGNKERQWMATKHSLNVCFIAWWRFDDDDDDGDDGGDEDE